jgi:beta-glucosidase-like glycosyl hydrolase
MRVLLAALTIAMLLAQPGNAARGDVDDLTLEQQVGQLLVLSFSGKTPPEYVRRALRERRVAGVILFGGNIASPALLRALTRVLRGQGGRPIVAVDQEGGEIRRVPWVGPVRGASELLPGARPHADRVPVATDHRGAPARRARVPRRRVTDSMEARASLATGGITMVCERAIRAGADLLLLPGKSSYEPVYGHLLAVARRSPEVRARVRESAARVLQLKARSALPPG